MKGTESHYRFQELDALRGLAAFAVVLYHYTSRYDRIYGYPGGSPLELHFGKFGVELFFMISGFVIFMSLKNYVPAIWDVWILQYHDFLGYTLPSGQQWA